MTLKRFVLLAERHKERVQREDRRAGEVAAMIYNMKRDAQKDPDGWSWRDVFPEWQEETGEQSEEEMMAVMQMWSAATKHLPS